MGALDRLTDEDLQEVARIVRDILRGRATLDLAEVTCLVRFCMAVLGKGDLR